jgi:hypothetical protein
MARIRHGFRLRGFRRGARVSAAAAPCGEAVGASPQALRRIAGKRHHGAAGLDRWLCSFPAASAFICSPSRSRHPGNEWSPAMKSTPVSLVKTAFAFAAAAAVVSFAGSAHADTVRGGCSYDGANFTFADAVVFKEANPFDDKKLDTMVVLTTFAIDKAKLAKETDNKSYAIADQSPGTDDARRLSLRISDGKVATANYQSSGTSVSTSGGDIGQYTQKANDAKRVAGDFVLEDDDKEDLQCNVGFDLAYATTTAATASGGGTTAKSAPAAAKGKALPAGGGEAGKVFQANLAAMQKGDVNAMLATVTKEQGDKMRAQQKDPQFGAMLEMMKSFAPKSATVTGGQDFGDTAELTIEAVDQSGGKSSGVSKLRKEGGAWKVEKTSMKGGL